MKTVKTPHAAQITSFQKNMINIHGLKGETWVSFLPKLIQELKDLWGLSDLRPLENLSFHYVLAGFQGKRPIVLKVGFDHKSLAQEIRALEAYQGYGAVRVIEHKPGALLMEHILPGTCLSASQNEHALLVACKVMKRLHCAPIPPGLDCLTIEKRLNILEGEWDLPAAYLDRARKIKEKNPINQTEVVLLHGDLHRGNILLQGKNNWIAIDPKGVIGNPIHEAWAFIEDFEKDTQCVASFFNFDLQLLRDWCFVHFVLTVCWCLEDKIDPHRFFDRMVKASHWVSGF